MGNTPSWSAQCFPDRLEVTVDLRRFHADLPYDFEGLGGNFHLPFALGHRTLRVGDFIALAQQDVPVLGRVEVDTERRRKVNSDPGSQTVDRLVVGVSQPLLKSDSDWKKIKRLETDIGAVLVEVRVVSDVVGILKMEMKPGNWLHRGGAYLVGRAEGSVEIYVRGRFETQQDRTSSLLNSVLLGALGLGSLLLMRLGWFLATPRPNSRLPSLPAPPGGGHHRVPPGGLAWGRGHSEDVTPPIYGLHRAG